MPPELRDQLEKFKDTRYVKPAPAIPTMAAEDKKKLMEDIDLEEISQKIKTQNEEIHKLRRRSPVIDKYLSQLEGGFTLNEKEQERLAKEVYQSLKEYEWE